MGRGKGGRSGHMQAPVVWAYPDMDMPGAQNRPRHRRRAYSPQCGFCISRTPGRYAQRRQAMFAWLCVCCRENHSHVSGHTVCMQCFGHYSGDQTGKSRGKSTENMALHDAHISGGTGRGKFLEFGAEQGAVSELTPAKLYRSSVPVRFMPVGCRFRAQPFFHLWELYFCVFQIIN